MIASLLACILIGPSTETKVLDRAHSHNDYLRPRPLFDALDNGFSSVEVDVYLVDGKLLVGHDRKDLKPERTIESLYLKPLSNRLMKNSGRVYRDSKTTFWVLVDIKEDGLNVYTDFKKSLSAFQNLEYRSNKSPVRFVVSGDRPVDSIVQDKGKIAALDGRWPDLDKGYSKELMPWVSESWLDHFSWLGVGGFPSDSGIKLSEMVGRAHKLGRKIRFWGAPDTKSIWELHYQSGVDWINTDHPSGLKDWFAKH